MLQKPGQKGLLPRSTTVEDTQELSSSSEDEESLADRRPARQRKQPAWMAGGEYVVPQVQEEYVFTVPENRWSWV